jgi:hypothetical protein
MSWQVANATEQQSTSGCAKATQAQRSVPFHGKSTTVNLKYLDLACDDRVKLESRDTEVLTPAHSVSPSKLPHFPLSVLPYPSNMDIVVRKTLSGRLES